MKTLPISRYRFFQKIQPLFLLKKIASKSITGCLQVFSPSGSLSIYTEEGKLIYACYSENLFPPLYKHLQYLSQYISTLPKDIFQQLQAIFEQEIQNRAIPNPDYLAICWLVNQKYLTPSQAEVLIETLALDVIESFLKLDQGSYEFISDSFLEDLPKFCCLNLPLLVQKCQPESQIFSEQFWESPQPQPKTQSEEVSHLSTLSNQQVTAKPNQKKPFTILCINDSSLLLESIHSYLDEQIFSVIGLRDVGKALLEVLRINPDLILVDVTPNLDGYELCSLLRKNIHFQKTPVIMVTSKITLINRAKAKLAKASGSLLKPFTQGDLLKMIFEHIV